MLGHIPIRLIRSCRQHGRKGSRKNTLKTYTKTRHTKHIWSRSLPCCLKHHRMFPRLSKVTTSGQEFCRELEAALSKKQPDDPSGCAPKKSLNVSNLLEHGLHEHFLSEPSAHREVKFSMIWFDVVIVDQKFS